MSLYLDASVIIPLFNVEAGSASVRALLDNAESPLVGDFAAGEVASGLARQVRTSEMTMQDANDALQALDRWRQLSCDTPPFDPADIRVAALFVRRFDLKLRLPDAIHAACCQRLGATLVTFDQRLAGAAAALGIDALLPA